jgi:putative transposase
MPKRRNHDAAFKARVALEALKGELPIGAQYRLLPISRSSFYYSPLGETNTNLALMRVIDKQFLDTPFFGVRQMTWHLRNEGHPVNPLQRLRRFHRLRVRELPPKQELRFS